MLELDEQPVLELDEQLLQDILQSLGCREYHLPHGQGSVASQRALSAGLPQPQEHGLGQPRRTQTRPLRWDALGSRRGLR